MFSFTGFAALVLTLLPLHLECARQVSHATLVDIVEHEDTSPLDTFSLPVERDLRRVSLFFTGHMTHLLVARGAPKLLKSTKLVVSDLVQVVVPQASSTKRLGMLHLWWTRIWKPWRCGECLPDQGGFVSEGIRRACLTVNASSCVEF